MTTPSPTALGLFYLAKGYTAEPPIVPSASPGLINTRMQGMLWREGWDRLNKNGRGNYDWAFLDACFSAAKAHGKGVALQILSGGSPDWFFALPNAKKFVSAVGRQNPFPADPVFQTEWESVQTALAYRYKNDPSLKYIKMAGPGVTSESFYAITPQEIIDADTIAISLGYANANVAWQAGVKWLIDMYERVWNPVPIQLITGPPFGQAEGSPEALQAMFDYGDANHRGRFGAAAHSLTSGSPHTGEPSATIIQAISPHCIATGYQFGSPQNPSDSAPPAKLKLAFDRAIGFGAHVIEVFDQDADDPVSIPVLDNVLAQLFPACS